MRIVSIGNALLLALVVAGCKNDRARELEPTTTTGADMPAVERDNAPPAVNVPGDPATPSSTESTTETTAGTIDLDTVVAGEAGGKKVFPTAPVERKSTRDVLRDKRDPRDISGAGNVPADPDRRGSSFESSGGISGLGTYGKKVPGQERFDTKPNRLRDGG